MREYAIQNCGRTGAACSCNWLLILANGLQEAFLPWPRLPHPMRRHQFSAKVLLQKFTERHTMSRGLWWPPGLARAMRLGR